MTNRPLSKTSIHSVFGATLRFVRLAVFLLASSAILACSPFIPEGLDSNGRDGAFLTGGQTDDGKLQTAGSDDGELLRLKQSIDQNEPETAALTRSIEDVRLERLDANGKPDSKNFKKIVVAFFFKSNSSFPKELEFESVIKKGASLHSATELSPVVPAPYRLAIECRDASCETSILRLKAIDDAFEASSRPPRTLGEAALIYRIRNVQPEVIHRSRVETKATRSQRLERLEQDLKSIHSASYKTLEVAWGVSRFHLDLTQFNLCPQGLLVETAFSAEPLKTDCDGRLPTRLQARMIGNNNRGSLLIKIQDGDDWILLKVNAPSSNSPLSDERADESGGVPFDPTHTVIPVNPDHPITKAWEKDRSNPVIRSYVEQWSRSSRLRSFLLRVRPNLNVLTGAMRSQNLPNEMIYITLIESHYFVSPDFPVEVSSASAVGPWQFLKGTAQDMGLKTYPLIRKGNIYQAHSCDERAHLEKSSYAAARYFAQLFKRFPNDPKLALMAYNWGPGNVSGAVNCLKQETCIQKLASEKNQLHRLEEIREANLDYWSVREFKMASNESIQYVLRFLGAHFAGRDPQAVGIDLSPQNGESDTYPAAPISTCIL